MLRLFLLVPVADDERGPRPLRVEAPVIRLRRMGTGIVRIGACVARVVEAARAVRRDDRTVHDRRVDDLDAAGSFNAYSAHASEGSIGQMDFNGYTPVGVFLG